LALGDISIYSKDNGNGYPGDIQYPIATATTVPQILSGEPVYRAAGAGFVSALASGTAAVNYPVIGGGPTALTPIIGIAASTSSEGTSGNINGSVSVTPIGEPITYLISTLITSTYFGQPSSGITLQQKTYDAMVGSRVTFSRTGGAGASQLGGTYTINATDATANGLIVESLDIQKFPGKVRFSFRNAVGYDA
jgi:hypothetical protein